ncbi:MAG: ArsR family transcriptional regulator [Clostridiales bacterium]|nr:ArsR family transcriptional regulator [Clostridiales bacterium]
MKNLELNLEDPQRLCAVAKALGSEVRIRIMQLLNECSMNIVELAQRLNVPISTVSNNIVILEEADLIRTERQNGVRGVMKLCSRKKDNIFINLGKAAPDRVESMFQVMPIGQYSDCWAEPVCGLVNSTNIIGRMDDPTIFYDPDRVNAQLLWFRKGYVEYRFSRQALTDHFVTCLEVSFEACSEAPNYRKDWPSDISVWINEVELGTWQCPGDFGGRRGRYSPDFWPLSSTQYGLLKHWKVDDKGCMLDDQRISDVTLDQLHLEDKPYISLRIGIREDALHQGGINLFGEKFGDYNQAIIMRLDCMKKSGNEGRNEQ